METLVHLITAGWQDAALTVLRAGGVVGVPTETVYGLAGDATNPDAVAAIYAAKGRPSHNPLIAHMADVDMAQRYAVLDERVLALADAFWPGPLTMVLPLAPDADLATTLAPSLAPSLAPAVTAGGDSLAVRCPRGPLGELARLLNRPIAAPSANKSGHISPTIAHHVLSDLQGGIPLILDGGPTKLGLESTIVDMRGMPVLLRPGAITGEAIEAVLGFALPSDTSPQEAPVAPGQLASHYAPGAPVRLNVLPGDVRPGEAYLGFGDHQLARHPTLSASGSLEEAAEQLYSALRTLDKSKPTGIAIAPIPTTGLGQALNDRLSRAAAPRD
ncbi:MAG: L-threonylcarbamoyladenylate synthase [Devosiaceae bacterium]